MAEKAHIEKLVEAIKGYFSIIGLLLVGIYLIKSPGESFLRIPFFNYLGGLSAVLVGTITGVWYSAHLMAEVLPAHERTNFGQARVLLLWALAILSLLVLLTVTLGAISMSCGQLMG
jgi:hypothetical protein